jgi:hypothetical protein
MRTITMLLAAALLFCAGCPDGDSAPQDGGGGDLPAPLFCSAAAEQPHTAHCQYGRDTTCQSSVGKYQCVCQCTGYWECDQVKVVCDPDAGMPND